MTMQDTLLADMIRITEEQNTALHKEASEVPELQIDESQFSMLVPAVQEEFNLVDLAFVENVVIKEAVDYDGQDKEILKEKKKATDHPDIVDLAHPDTAYMAEGPMGTGVVENQNQQHEKILNVVQRMPSGFHYNKFADLVQALVSMAEGLENKGDSEAARKVDVLTGQLVKVNSFLALTPETIKEGADVPAPASGVPAYKAPSIPAHKALVPSGPKALVPQIMPDISPDQKALPPASKSGPLAKLPAGPTIDMDPPRGPAPKRLGPSNKVKPISRPALPGRVSGTGLFGRLSRFLAGKGGKLSLILSGIGVAAFLHEQFTDKQLDLDSNLQTIKGSTSPKVLEAANDIGMTLEAVKTALETGKSEEAIDNLARAEESLNLLVAHTGQESPAIQSAVNNLEGTWKNLAGQSNAFINRGLQEQGESAKDERTRLSGVQSFLKEHMDETHPTTGILDARTRQAIHDFVEGMRDDLGIAPKMLTAKNLMESGTADKFERLWDIWRRPHLYANKAV